MDGVLDAASIGQPLLPALRDGGSFVALLPFAAPTAERGVQVHGVHVVLDAAQLRELLELTARGRLRTRIAGPPCTTSPRRTDEQRRAGRAASSCSAPDARHPPDARAVSVPSPGRTRGDGIGHVTVVVAIGAGSQASTSSGGTLRCSQTLMATEPSSSMLRITCACGTEPMLVCIR